MSTELDDRARVEAMRAPLTHILDGWTRGHERIQTPIPNLGFFRREMPSEPCPCMVEPSVALVVQGSKRAILGNHVYTYDIHRFLITSLDLPAMMHVVEASAEQPYLGLVLKLDLRVMAELMVQSRMVPPQPVSDCGMMVGETSWPLITAFARLVELLQEPEAIPVLAPLLEREIYYRLLTSSQSARLWQIASVGSQSHRVARAVEWLRAHYRQALRVEELASQVQMSPSTFHHHFRLLTAMSPLQFQKCLRLNEARRLMLAEHQDVSSTAFEVGYESPSQFSREYSRMFGASPRRDIEALRRLAGVS